MNVQLSAGEFQRLIHMAKDETPLFKDEITHNAKIQATSEYRNELLRNLFEQTAKSLSNSQLKKRIKATNLMRSSFYQAVSEITHIETKVIKKKIEEYVKAHPGKVLNFAKEISAKSGWSLQNVHQKDLLKLIRQTSIGIFDQQPMMKNQHIANFIIAKISSEIFDININLHDIVITYDQDFNGGVVMEQLNLKATSSENAPQLNLMQGFVIINSGLFSDNPQQAFYHIEPQELIPENQE